MVARFTLSADTWNTLTPSQKTALGLGALILVVVVAVVVSLASAPRFVPLYGQLSSQDAAQVAEKLTAMKVTYRVSSNGTSIEVPEERVGEVRLALAGEGIPQGGHVGFELFDKSQIGQSVFGERLNYIRALQGELARTISQLQTVQTARVHLALPERRLYRDDDSKASASVVLELRGPSPTPREIKSIVHLVSSAVEGLDPTQVTVVDTTGSLLSEVIDGIGDGIGSTRTQAQRTASGQIEERVQSMLDRVLGPGKAIVRANVILNFNRKQVERELYSPGVAEGNGVLESERIATETYNGTRPALGGAAGGAVGVVPNTTPEVAIPRASSTAGEYNREERNTQYRVSKELIHEEVTPGQIERITLALFVDESVESGQLEHLKRTVSAAAGIDVARGDVVEVQPMAFDTSIATSQEAEAKTQARTEMIMTIAKYGGTVILVIVFLFILRSMYRATMAPVMAKMMPQPASGGKLPMLASGGTGLPMAMTAEELEQEQEQEEAEEESDVAKPPKMKKPLEEQLELNTIEPQRIAQVIKNLIAED